jgi:hypothetical protein
LPPLGAQDIWRGPPRAGREISDPSPWLYPAEQTRSPPASTAATFSVEDPFLFFIFLAPFILLDLVETPESDMQIFVMDLL